MESFCLLIISQILIRPERATHKTLRNLLYLTDYLSDLIGTPQLLWNSNHHSFHFSFGVPFSFGTPLLELVSRGLCNQNRQVQEEASMSRSRSSACPSNEQQRGSPFSSSIERSAREVRLGRLEKALMHRSSRFARPQKAPVQHQRFSFNIKKATQPFRERNLR